MLRDQSEEILRTANGAPARAEEATMSTVLITGASSGIGKETAKHFHDKGWNVIATMRAPDKEEELAGLDDVLVTRLDVTDPQSIADAVGESIERFGGIDVLVNNAGYGAYGPLEATSMDTIRRQFDTNVVGLLETTKAVLPHFRARKGGTVVNISSIGGRITFDFGGRSLEVSNDESMVEYQGVVRALFAGMEPMMANASPPSVVAEVIYTAATDGTDRLRYPAGADAVEMMAARSALDDATLIAGFKEQMGL